MSDDTLKPEGDKERTPTLMAVDLGLRSGIALFNSSGELLRYRSTNFGSRKRLKKSVYRLIKEAGPPTYLILEGARGLASIWKKAARKQGTTVMVISAETWRPALLNRRRRRSGADAKEAADELARQIIATSDAAAPTSLRHDAAEAIAIGWWGLQEVGWR